MQNTKLVRLAAAFVLVGCASVRPIHAQGQTQVQTQSGAGQPAGAPARDVAPGEKKGTASIKGKVVTADGGRPLRRVQVSVSGPDLTEPHSVSTNSQGVFEIKELPSGRYNVSATRAGFLRLSFGQRRPGEAGQPIQLADGQAIDRIDFALPRMSVISGRITDEIGEPLAGVSVFAMQSRYFRGRRRMVPAGPMVRTDDTGEYRLIGLEPGDYYVMGTTRDTWTMEDDAKQRVGFGPTYFAGTLVTANAQLVKLKLGQEASGIDFGMVPGRVATISGTAMTSSGVPLAGESISLGQEFAGPTFMSSFGFGGGRVGADGTFTIKDVSPGEYKLSVRYPGDKDHPSEGATTVVSVTGADLEGVSLVTGAAGSVSGRVVTDDGTPLALGTVGSGRNDARLRVMLRPVDSDSTPQGSYSQDNGRVRDDGTFDVTEAFGASRISVFPLPSGFAVKSIELEGKDYADLPLEVRNGQKIESVTITISKNMPTLRGQLIDEKAQPALGTVILFPQDAAKWGEGSRLVKTARPDPTGAFEIRYLPAGDYFLAPVDYMQPGASDDPEFLKGLQENGAQRITITQTSAPAITLTLKK